MLAGAATVAGGGALERLLRAGVSPAEAVYVPGVDVSDTGRILVMIQLDGGLDFLNTIVPTGSRYRDLRRGGGALNDDELLRLDSHYDINANLPGLAASWTAGELAVVHGVGLPQSSLSHFVDHDAWARGRLEVADGSGWLGRTLDALAVDADPMIGISVGGLTPAMSGPRFNSVALPDDGQLPWSAAFVEGNPGIVAAFQQMLTDAGQTGATQTLADRVRTSQHLVRDVAAAVSGATDLDALAEAAEIFGEDDDAFEGAGPLANQLRLVADLINGGLPTRAYHTRFGDFDTHAGQQGRLPILLGEVDQAISTFRNALGANADRVVIATWTEFGRRPDWNGDGTDHGTAGTQFVLGAGVSGGHYGEHVSLDRFDRDDNFRVTTDFSTYLSGLAQSVLGVDASVAIPGQRTPMEFT